MIPNPPSSPGAAGVGFRRKGPKTIPKLPLSAFTPPNSGTNERFPLPPSPSTVHPESVIDANVAQSTNVSDLSDWLAETGQVLGGRVGGVVLRLPNNDLAQISGAHPELVLSVVVPFALSSEDEPVVPDTSEVALPVSFSTIFSQSTEKSKERLKSVLDLGRPVDVDIQVSMSDAVFDEFIDLLTKATETSTNVPPLVISNLLPPPHDLELPIVKLMNHPTYRAFQARIAALSLFPTVHIKFLPPAWNAPTPSVEVDEASSKQQKEWKRRIRMYLGPVLEAFGYERIVFGSSPPAASSSVSKAGDWYELARESLAELGVDQEAVDGVFGANARRVYGPKKE